MRFLGFIFLALLISTSTVILDILLPGNFLMRFIDDHYIETFAALIGFNIASVTFLLGQLITIEATINKNSLFDNTRKEIKQNAYFLLATFLMSLFILVIRPDFIANVAWQINLKYYVTNAILLAIFLIALFAIFEILSSVFSVGKFFKKG